MSVVKMATPGIVLGSTAEAKSGPGTHVIQGTIYASLVGLVQTKKEGDQTVISVINRKRPNVVPEIGDIVTCRVTKINLRMAYVEIHAVNDHLLQSPFSGTIRTRDVRAFDIDQVEIYKSYRPGDIIRALVISLGDSRSYYLSTARNDLGVITAIGRGGVPMIPISWEVMQCPVTMVKEFRKVAKVLDESKKKGGEEGKGGMRDDDDNDDDEASNTKAREGATKAEANGKDIVGDDDNDDDDDDDNDDDDLDDDNGDDDDNAT